MDHDVTDYLVSVSDVMSGLLYVFIIALAVLALRSAEARQSANHEAAKRKLEAIQYKARYEAPDAAARALLDDIERRLRARGVMIHIDRERMLLELPEEILFEPGQADLQTNGEIAVATLADVLMDAIKPYTRGCGTPAAAPAAWLDALFIEGHTDNTPLVRGGLSEERFRDNWGLSVFRAINTYKGLVRHQPELKECLNGHGHAILTVSGYADQRPVDGHEHATPTPDKANRRINLRFVMAPADTSADQDSARTRRRAPP